MNHEIKLFVDSVKVKRMAIEQTKCDKWSTTEQEGYLHT